MRRRDFLEMTVLTAAGAAAPSLFGCGGGEAAALRVFPQGVASGDPRPDSLVLWTRVEPVAGVEEVSWELARDEAFRQVVSKGDARVDGETDHTLRVKVTGLESATRYFYRFLSRGISSTVGRAKSAPAVDSDVPVRLALASCQDFVGRWFHAWKVLADEAEPVDWVLFLGDYIYETTATAGAREPTEARHTDLPDGMALGETEDAGRAAVTLADFRALYRKYRTDPDLRRVHALFPFVSVWDDHEFGNDCWQDHTNHFDGAKGDEQNRASREAATRAYAEYLPLDPERDAAAQFPDDLKLYRSLRFGKHVELFVTDQRYYRSDHVVPEGPPLPEVGKRGTNTILGSRSFVVKAGFDPLEAQTRPTMLGAAQRDWLIDAVRASTATWKVIGSQTMMAQLLVDLTAEPNLSDLLTKRFYLKTDQWDGYRTERAELLTALAGVSGVVVLTGDLHATYASQLRPDFDLPGPATAVEYLVPGISAVSLHEQLEAAIEIEPLLAALGLKPVVRRADDITRASNPHVRYVKNRAYGYATVVVQAGEVQVTFVHVPDVQVEAAPDAVERVRFRTRLGSNDIEPLD